MYPRCPLLPCCPVVHINVVYSSPVTDNSPKAKRLIPIQRLDGQRSESGFVECKSLIHLFPIPSSPLKIDGPVLRSVFNFRAVHQLSITSRIQGASFPRYRPCKPPSHRLSHPAPAHSNSTHSVPPLVASTTPRACSHQALIECPYSQP